MNVKAIARQVLPPFIRTIRIRLHERAVIKKQHGIKPFLKWWGSQKSSDSLDRDLRQMITHFVGTHEAKLMSNYWWYLAKRNIEQLACEGYENFKQTVARNYYTWVGVDSTYLMGNVDILAAVKKARSLSLPIGEIYRKHDHFTLEESISFNLNTVLMYCALEQPDLIDEPDIGNPPAITIGSKLVSQDIMNSYLDYSNLSNLADLTKVKCILELGGGYGRTAHYILSKHTDLSYILVDIPPALHIAQKYLQEIFPEKTVVTFKSDVTAREINAAISVNSLIFLTPDQMKLIEDKKVDIFIAIDNLHAMKIAQVEHYLSEVDRLASIFYFTCWPGMPMPYDNYTHDSETWPIPSNWSLTSREKTIIPSCYENICYQVS